MDTYDITVERAFSATHALKLPDGSIEPTHGHDWPVWVTVTATRLDDMQAVMDFHELEAAVDAVLQPWRGKHLNDVEPFIDGTVNPSAERVAWWIALQTQHRLGDTPHRWVSAATVGEAPGCRATYRPAR